MGWPFAIPNERRTKQRVAIARPWLLSLRSSLRMSPRALDSTTSTEVMALLKELNQDGMTMVVVTHETDIAEACGRTIRLRDGLVETLHV